MSDIVVIVISAIAAAFFGFIFWLLKAVLPVQQIRKWAQRNIWDHLTWVVISLMLLFASLTFLGLWLTSEGEKQPITIVPKVTLLEIDEPQTIAITKSQFEVEGTCSGVLDDSTIWVVLFPLDSNREFGYAKFYIQRGPAHCEVRSERVIHWRVWVDIWAYIEHPEGLGKQFEVFVVLADEGATAELHQHLEEVQKGERPPGRLRLPSGAKRRDTILVTVSE